MALQVYEEQGYEDAAYDHGGYKKAGEHHENKPPGEQVLNYLQATHKWAAQPDMRDAVAPSLRRSSRGKRNRKPKSKFQESKSSRKVAADKKRATLFDEDVVESDKNNSKEKLNLSRKQRREAYPSFAVRQRKNEDNTLITNTYSNNVDEFFVNAIKKTEKNETPEEMQLGEETKVKINNSQDENMVKPTTHHPPISSKMLAELHRRQQNVKGKFFRAKKTNSHEYLTAQIHSADGNEVKFQVPFTTIQNYDSETKMQWLLNGDGEQHKWKAKIPIPFQISAYRVNQKKNWGSYFFRDNNIKSRNHEDDEKRKAKNVIVAWGPFFYKPYQSKLNVKEEITFRGNIKFFPLEMNAGWKRDELQTSAKAGIVTSLWLTDKKLKRKKHDFLYQFIGTVANAETFSNHSRGRFMSTKFQTILNEDFIFWQPKESPWFLIPLKKEHSIRSKNGENPEPTKIVMKVLQNARESDSAQKIQMFHQIIPPNSLRSTSTSYSIKHVYPNTDLETSNNMKSKIIKTPRLLKTSLFTFFQEKRPIDFKTSVFEFTFSTPSSLNRITRPTSSLRRFFIFVRTMRNKDVRAPDVRPSRLDSAIQNYTKNTEALVSHLMKDIENSTDIRYNMIHGISEVSHEFPDLKTHEKINSSGLGSLSTTSNHIDFAVLVPNIVEQNDIKPEKVIDYSPSGDDVVKNSTLPFYSDLQTRTRYELSTSNFSYRVNNFTDPLKRDTVKRPKRNLSDNDSIRFTRKEMMDTQLHSSTTEMAVDVGKYPFYRRVLSDSLSKYSVIRYVLNPNRTPRKSAGRMSFYESTEHIRCPRPSVSQNVATQRENAGWPYDEHQHYPRMRNVGDSISCLKVKFFGSDPLDNPFFKEEYIGFPEIFPVTEHDRREIRPTHKKKRNIIGRPDRYETKFFNVHAKKNTTDKYDINLSLRMKWIHSIAELEHRQSLIRPYKRFLHKRSTKTDDDYTGNREVVQKVYLSGGFINVKNTAPRSTNLPKNFRNLLKKAPTFASNGNHSRNTTAFTSNIPGRVKIAYGLRAINRSYKHANASLAVQQPDKEALDLVTVSTVLTQNAQQDHFLSIPSDKHKTSRDALLTFDDAVTETVDNVAHQFDQEYKRSNRKNIKYPRKYENEKDELGTPPPSKIDSLLYVIHPRTGRGEWMKVLEDKQVKHNLLKIDLFDSSDKPRERISSNTIKPLASPLYTGHHIVRVNYFDPNAITERALSRKEVTSDNKTDWNKISELSVSISILLGR